MSCHTVMCGLLSCVELCCELCVCVCVCVRCVSYMYVASICMYLVTVHARAVAGAGARDGAYHAAVCAQGMPSVKAINNNTLYSAATEWSFCPRENVRSDV